MTTIRYGDAAPLVRAWALKQDASFSPWKPRWALRNDIPGAVLGNGALSSPYSNIVLRVLNALADEGVLVKTGSGRRIRFWRPDAHERHLADLADRAGQHETVRKYWQDIRDRLAALGYAAEPDVEGALGVRLPPEYWQLILSRLEKDREPAGPVTHGSYRAGP